MPDGYRVQMEFLDMDFAGDGLKCYEDRLDLFEGMLFLLLPILTTKCEAVQSLIALYICSKCDKNEKHPSKRRVGPKEID